MASRTAGGVLIAVAIAATACATTTEPPEITRALLPPTPPQVTTTTTAPVDPVAADRAAQEELRTVVAASQAVRAEQGAYGLEPQEVATRVPGVNVISLSEAALSSGVVYDARPDRATLFAHSESGTWFCVGLSAEGDDFGFAEDFDGALTACSDGTLGADWGDPLSPSGPDESAIEATLRSLAEGLAIGDTEVVTTFRPIEECSDLAERWPNGLPLSDSADLDISSISIIGDRATVDARLAPLDGRVWELEKTASSWQVVADPCRLLDPILTDRMELAANDLLESGLYAVRSAFVIQEDFGFGAGAVAGLDAALEFVPRGEVGFGTLYYSGSPTEGLLVTGGSPGVFYCAVESLSAATVYGRGESADEVRTPARCRQRSR